MKKLLKTLIVLVLIAGVGGGVAAYAGIIFIPGITPEPSGTYSGLGEIEFSDGICTLNLGLSDSGFEMEYEMDGETIIYKHELLGSEVEETGRYDKKANTVTYGFDVYKYSSGGPLLSDIFSEK